MHKYLLQTKLILELNLIRSLRNKKELLQQLLVPLLIGLLIVFTSDSPIILELLLPLYLPMSITGFTRRLLVNFTTEKQEQQQAYL